MAADYRDDSGKNEDRGGSFGGGRGGRGGREGREGRDGKKKPRRSSFRKRRPPASLSFDYKRVADLMPFMTEEGKIIPARVSGLRAGQQRELTLAIKRARNLAFVSPTRRFSVGH